MTADGARIEVFANPQPDRDYVIRHRCPEFTSVCPITGLPDFGAITITYTPDRECIELKSLKYYLFGYRQRGIFYEAVTNRILDDLVAACRPRRMRVRARFRVRGGISSRVTADYVAQPHGAAE
jgi:7-cyano-7-deazaguanine reductase